jgi:hypothetical protein
MESNDATFFEDIFPMKGSSSSSNQEMPSSSSQELFTIFEPTISIEHSDNPVEDNNEAPTRSKRQRTAMSFGDDFIVYIVDDTPLLFWKPMHLKMLTTGKKPFAVRWIPSWQMGLGKLLIVLMGANLQDVSGCSRKSLDLTVLLKSTRHALLPRVIPRKKA